MLIVACLSLSYLSCYTTSLKHDLRVYVYSEQRYGRAFNLLHPPWMLYGRWENLRGPGQNYIWKPYVVVIFKQQDSVKNRWAVLQRVENTIKWDPILIGPCFFLHAFFLSRWPCPPSPLISNLCYGKLHGYKLENTFLEIISGQ